MNNNDGAGLFVKARTTGSASTNPATLNDVTITNNFISNNGNGTYSAGIRFE
ncbi:MAG: hypothetical protein IPH20_00010 [Bacteroidales bacterium]|nr:hypothetical protein [Bacteroidales bacterium]